jgi:hypothetical protein
MKLARKTVPALASGALLLAHAVVTLGCAPPPQRKPLEMTPIGTVPNIPRKAEESEGGATTTPNSGTPLSATKESPCSGGDFDALDETLRQCDSGMPRAGEVPAGMRDRLEVRVTSSAISTPPGSRIEVTVTLRNKSSDPLPLFFSGDPAPHFEVDAFDAKGRRVDLPTSKQPKTPAVPARDVKASKVTLTPGGTARLRIPWEAVKMRWAPEKVKGWEGRGYPRVAAGGLPAGKYTLRAVLPLIGVFEKGDLEIPKLVIDVGS